MTTTSAGPLPPAIFARAGQLLYHRVLLQQPGWPLRGLVQRGPEVYVVVGAPPSRLLSSTGEPALKWFKGIATWGAQLTDNPPLDAEPVPMPTPHQVVAGRGIPRTIEELLDDLRLLLPPDFPDFGIADGHAPMRIRLLTTRPLTQDERQAFTGIVDQIDSADRWDFEVRDLIAHGGPWLTSTAPLRLGSIRSSNVSQAVRLLYEHDEEVWLSNRNEAFQGDFSGVEPESDASTVVLETTMQKPADIRNFLTQYQRVRLPMPLSDRQDVVLAHLGLSAADLVRLVELGRVQILLPQPLHRYSYDLIERMAESAPIGGVIPSRQLALRTMRGMARANPLLFSPLDVPTRRAILQCLGRLSKASSGLQAIMLEARANALGKSWADAPERIHRLGARGVSRIGIAGMLAEVRTRLGGSDAWIEFDAAAELVEWGMISSSAVAAGQVRDTGGYDHGAYVEVVANAYGGRLGTGPQLDSTLPIIVDELLAVNSEVPVLEVAQAFSPDDIDRFRGLVSHFAALDAETRAAQVAEFNERVLDFEAKRERLAGWRLSGSQVQLGAGAVTAMGSYAIGDPSGGVLFAFASWIAQHYAQEFLEELALRIHPSALAERLPESWLASAFGTDQSTIAVARMRQGVMALR